MTDETTKNKNTSRRRGGGPRAVATLVPRLTKKALGKRGFSEAGVITEWAAIVGEERARVCRPEKLVFPRGERSDGTLHLLVAGPAAVEVQHDAPRIIERINGYFGYAAVTALKLVNAPVAAPEVMPKQPRRQPADPAALAEMREKLRVVDDPELRQVLDRLGESVISNTGE